jgi:hypothetical protein
MRALMFVAVLLLIGVIGVGFYQGWFHLSTSSTDHSSSATISVDQEKIRVDEQKAKDKVQDLKQDAKEKTNEWADKAKE